MALRIGVAGLRRGASLAHVLQLRPDCELAAVCDLDAERARAFARQHGVPQWFEDYGALLGAPLDAIVVATPAPTHVDCTVQALHAGKHVLCEVPACWTVAEARQLVATVRASSRRYMLAENMCYFAYCQAYRDMIRQGDIGEPVYVEGEYIHNCETLMVAAGPDGRPQRTWRAHLPPIHYCTHELGPILQWLDDRIVSAVGLHTGNRRRPDLGCIDLEVGLFRTARGRLVKVLCGFSVAKEPAHHWFTVYGTEGHLESPRWPDGEHRLQSPRLPHQHAHARLALGVDHPGAPPEARAGGHGTSEYFMCDDFVRSVLEDRDPPLDVFAGLDMTLPGICAHQSAAQGGQPVPVPDPRAWTGEGASGTEACDR